MTLNRKPRVLSVGALLLGFSLLATPASALSIRLSDGVTTQTIGDNVFGDTNPLLGIISVSGAFGAFDINVITGITDPILGTSEYPLMDLSQVSVNYYGGSSGSLTVSLSDTGYSLTNTGSALLSSYIGGTYNNGSVTGSSSLDLGNALFGSPDILAQHSTYGGAIGSFGETSNQAFNYTSGQFSLTQTVNMVLGSPGTASFDLQTSVTSVPEPSSLLLSGFGLASMFCLKRRRRSA